VSPFPTILDDSSERWQWPVPPFAWRHLPPPNNDAGQSCTIESHVGTAVEGQMVGFDPQAGTLGFRTTAIGPVVTLPFSRFRRLTLTTPLQPAPQDRRGARGARSRGRSGPMDAAALTKLPHRIAAGYRVMPVLLDKSRLIVAVDKPSRAIKLSALQAYAQLSIVPVLAPRTQILLALERLSNDVWSQNVSHRPAFFATTT
jgi:hypothetical protein